MDDQPNETATEGELQKSSPDQVEGAFQGSAVFANKVYSTINPLGVRLTFMEVSPGGAEHYRTAVYLQHQDAAALRDLLVRQAERVLVEFETKQEKD